MAECNVTDFPPERLYRVMIAIEGVLILPIVGGNLLIMASVALFKRLQTTGNLLVCNLAVSDFLVGLLLLPFDIWYLLHPELAAAPVACTWRYALWISLLGASVANLFLISLERFVAIVFPFFYSAHVTMTRVLCACVGAWLPMLALASLPLLGWNAWDRCQRPAECDVYNIYDRTYIYLAYGILVVLIVLNTSLVTVVLRVALRQMASIRQQQRTFMVRQIPATLECAKADFKESKQRSQDARKALVMVAVFLLFVACWTPYMIGALLRMLGVGNDVVVLLRNVGLCFASTNACLNAGVYGWKKLEFRSAFKRLLCLKRNREVAPLDATFSEVRVISFT